MAINRKSRRKGRRLRPQAGIAIPTEIDQKRLGIIRPATRSKELMSSDMLESGSLETPERIVRVIVSLTLAFILLITWLIWRGYGHAA